VFWYPNPYSSFSLWLEDAILTSYLARHTTNSKNFSNRRKKLLLGKGTEAGNKKSREKKERWAWEELQINLVSFAKNHAFGKRKFKKDEKSLIHFLFLVHKLWSVRDIGSSCCSSSFPSQWQQFIDTLHLGCMTITSSVNIARRLSPSPFFSLSREFRNSDFWASLTWMSQFAIVVTKYVRIKRKVNAKKIFPVKINS